ncbi:MAG: putative ABC transporter permease, partial [Clostridiales bacterium]|nr:putative ABC transporter permease [Clostridiales bacterium]
MQDKKISYLYFYFMCYAFVGWLYETFFQIIVYQRDFNSRGVLSGPYLPVYGFGALACLLFLNTLKNKKITMKKINVSPILIFVGSMVIGTLTELVTSYMLEDALGKWIWNYTRFTINYQGRIALLPSVLFGIGGLVFIYILQPQFENFAKKLGEKHVSAISSMLFAIVLVDLVMKIF